MEEPLLLLLEALEVVLGVMTTTVVEVATEPSEEVMRMAEVED